MANPLNRPAAAFTFNLTNLCESVYTNQEWLMYNVAMRWLPLSRCFVKRGKLQKGICLCSCIYLNHHIGRTVKVFFFLKTQKINPTNFSVFFFQIKNSRWQCKMLTEIMQQYCCLNRTCGVLRHNGECRWFYCDKGESHWRPFVIYKNPKMKAPFRTVNEIQSLFETDLLKACEQKHRLAMNSAQILIFPWTQFVLLKW